MVSPEAPKGPYPLGLEVARGPALGAGVRPSGAVRAARSGLRRSRAERSKSKAPPGVGSRRGRWSEAFLVESQDHVFVLHLKVHFTEAPERLIVFDSAFGLLR